MRSVSGEERDIRLCDYDNGFKHGMHCAAKVNKKLALCCCCQERRKSQWWHGGAECFEK